MDLVPEDVIAPQDLFDEFNRYVHNDIPHRLIFIPGMKLLDRSELQEHYEPYIQSITEHDVVNACHISGDRKIAIKTIVYQTLGYAILSHRWLPRGEPTFREMTDGPVAGAGRNKLWSFCAAARARDLELAWSDTCCIDKSSSSELDEAIRSMYRWYRNSAVCMIHLAQTASIVNMERDEWFERGWTLQELLAPRVAKFFNADWQPITDTPNDKRHDEVIGRLVLATGCPAVAFKTFYPGPFDVDTRMTWAARRKTTRGEDMAYSLMGIFDVTLQPAYGEGAERAFGRLVELIMLSSGNASVLNWAGEEAWSHCSTALPSSPRCYLGYVPSGLSPGELYYRRLSQGLAEPDPSPFRSSPESLDIAMTSRGLRVPLVILALDTYQRGSPVNGFRRIHFRLSHGPLYHAVGEICIDIPERMNDNGGHHALGVFNYLTPASNVQAPRHPALRKESIAYLLVREHPPSTIITRQEEGTVVDCLSFAVNDWQKVSTREHVHFTIRTLGDMKAMVIQEQRLEVVYL